MNKHKRLLSFVLALVLVLGMFPLTASAEDEAAAEYCEYCNVELTENAQHSVACLTNCTCEVKPAEGEAHENGCKLNLNTVTTGVEDETTSGTTTEGTTTETTTTTESTEGTTEGTTESTTEPATTPTTETTEATTAPTTEPVLCEKCNAIESEDGTVVHEKTCEFYVPTTAEKLLAAESVEDMYLLVLNLMQNDPSALTSLTAEEIASLRARVNELDPEGDDTDTQDLLDTLAILPNAPDGDTCEECGQAGNHAEDCSKNTEVLLDTFSSPEEYSAYKFVSDKDGGVREQEQKIVDVRERTFAGIPVLSGDITYQYADVILGMNEAKDMEIVVPSSIIAPKDHVLSGYDSGATNPDYPEYDTCVTATEENKSIICDSSKYYVIYKDIGTYDTKANINLKVSVSDYALQKDASAWEDTRYPTIAIRVGEGRPGIEVAYISWIELKYEFIDDDGNPITVSGNTTYYDVDGSQLVHLNGKDNSCEGIYATDDCVLYLGTFNGPSDDYSSNGIGVFERANQGYSSEDGVDAQCAFTEIFTAATMYRTFSFIQNREVKTAATAPSYQKTADIYIDNSARYHSDEWGGGLIYNSGLPVVRKTGSLTIKKEVPENSGDRNKAFSFKIELSEELTGQFGDLSFNKGVATFTLKHGESVKADGLYEFLSYEITESDNANYKVSVNGQEVQGKYNGSLVGNGESTASNSVTFLVDTITFTNEYQLADLVIDKNVVDSSELALDPNQSFVFHVTGTPLADGVDNVDMYVTIRGDGEIKIKDLPVGNYTVEEITDWSWRYNLTQLVAENAEITVDNSEKIEFQLAYGGETVTATNDRTKDQWLSGDCCAENAWSSDGNSITKS